MVWNSTNVQIFLVIRLNYGLRGSKNCHLREFLTHSWHFGPPDLGPKKYSKLFNPLSYSITCVKHLHAKFSIAPSCLAKEDICGVVLFGDFWDFYYKNGFCDVIKWRHNFFWLLKDEGVSFHGQVQWSQVCFRSIKWFRSCSPQRHAQYSKSSVLPKSDVFKIYHFEFLPKRAPSTSQISSYK